MPALSRRYDETERDLQRGSNERALSQIDSAGQTTPNSNLLSNAGRHMVPTPSALTYPASHA
jgi:hypothetical protein